MTDFLNAVYYAHKEPDRRVADLRLGHGVLTTYWSRLPHGRRLGARDLAAFNRAFGRRRLASGRLDRTALVEGAADLLGAWFPAAWDDPSRRAHGIAFETMAAREQFDPATRKHARPGRLTPPRQPIESQQVMAYAAVPIPSADAAMGFLRDPARWPDMASDRGRFTALRRGGLPGQTFEIELNVGPARRLPAFARAYVTCSAVLEPGPDLDRAVASLARRAPAIADSGDAVALVELTTHSRHPLGAAVSRLLVTSSDTGAAIRDIGCWDPLPFPLKHAHDHGGHRAQVEFLESKARSVEHARPVGRRYRRSGRRLVNQPDRVWPGHDQRAGVPPPTARPAWSARLGGERRTGQLLVAFAAVLWSTAGVMQRELALGVGTQLAFRAFFAMLALFAFTAVANRGAVVAPFRAIGYPGIALAIVMAAASGFFIIALNHATVAHVLFVQASSPMMAALIALVFLGERVSRRSFVAMIVALAGVAVMVGNPDAFSLMGDGFSVLMALSFAIAIVITRQRKDISMTPAICLSQLFVLVAAAPFASTAGIGAKDLGLLFAMGLLQMGLGLALFTAGARLIPAAEVALITLLEVVLGPLWVLISIHERPDTVTLVGGAIVVAAVLVQAVGEPRTVGEVRAAGP